MYYWNCYSYSIVKRTLVFFFFFQAEDGIRDYKVTGVQTCALPIYRDYKVTGVQTCALPIRRVLRVVGEARAQVRRKLRDLLLRYVERMRNRLAREIVGRPAEAAGDDQEV